MSALSLLKNYERFFSKKKVGEVSYNPQNRNIDFLKALIQKPYQKKNIHLFVFFPDKFTMGGYDLFLETLDDRQKIYLKELIKDVLSTGSPFQTEVTTKEQEVIGLYGFPQGNCYLLLHLPLFSSQQNVEDLRFSYGQAHRYLEKLKDYCDLLPIMFWVRDDKQKVIFTNQLYQKFQNDDQNLDVFPKAKSVFLAQLALSKREQQEIILPLVYNGGIEDYRVFEIPYQDNKGVWHTLGYALNIAKEQKHEKVIEALLKGRSDMVHLLPLPVILFDEKRMIVSYNQKFLDLWNLTEAEMNNLPDHPTLLEKLQVKRLLPEYRDIKAWRNQQFQPYTDKNFIYQDKWHLPDCRIVTVTSGACTGSGIICFFEDMTHHLHIQKQNQNLLQNMRETLDSLDLAVALFSNDGALKVFNKDFNQFCDNKLYIGVHLSYLSDFLGNYPPFAQFSVNLLKAFSEGLSQEIIKQTVELPEEFYDLQAVRLETGDILITFRDISPQINYQNLLTQKAETLSELGHIREMFFRQISFQLREPMTAITGFSEVLEQKIFGDLTEKQAEYVGLLKMASGQMLGLIDNLIDLVSLDSNIEAMREQFSYHKMSKIIDSVMNSIQRQLSEKLLKCEINISDNLLIYGDYTSIRQTILQLLYNAIEVSPKGTIIKMNIHKDHKGVLIEICDKGQGIPQAIIDFMAHRTYYDKQDNLKMPIKGYGLYYVRRVCMMHDADLCFEIKDGTKVSLLFKDK